MKLILVLVGLVVLSGCATAVHMIDKCKDVQGRPVQGDICTGEFLKKL